jgi:hypothetical protein
MRMGWNWGYFKHSLGLLLGNMITLRTSAILQYTVYHRLRGLAVWYIISLYPLS